MKSSVWIAVGLTMGVVVWMLSGTLTGAPRPETTLEQHPQTTTPMKVEVATLQASRITREVVVQGDLEPVRRVQLRAETSGQVEKLLAKKGERLHTNQIVIRLREDDRRVQLAKADAQIASKQLDVRGMKSLKKQGLQAETQLRAAEAGLATALAEKKRLQLDLSRTQIRAPFAGVLENRQVELGSLVQQGDSVGEIVDYSTLKAVGHIPQQSMASLALGQKVHIRLLDGRTAEGILSYIAAVADPNTRSFRVEATIPNKNNRLRAGISAELHITVGKISAHFISPAVLTLDDKGHLGIKAVDQKNTVQFYPVSIIRTEATGAWVSGLPQQLIVITQGQGFVSNGERVEPIAKG